MDENDGIKVRTNGSKWARARLQAMQSQLTSAAAYCCIAETALTGGRPENREKAIQKARHTITTVRAHVEERDHVPADGVAGIDKRLAELDTRISSIEAQLVAKHEKQLGDFERKLKTG